MTDKREEILARLITIAKSVAGDDFVFRNVLDIPEDARPAIVILDSDESAVESNPTGRNTALLSMTPEIYLLVGSDSAGTDLNAFRARVLKAIFTDDMLVVLCANGVMRYEGFVTGFSAGRDIEANGLITISFHYVFRPRDF